MSLVIAAEELRAKLGSKELLLVDARPYASYSESHIPGAVNIDLMQFHWIDTSAEGIAQFNRQMRILLSNIGVSRDKSVVFYDDVSGPSAARGVWLLLYFSHRRVAMLDGGLDAWKALHLKTETKTNAFANSKFRGRTDPKILAGYRDLAKPVKNLVIIDSRSEGEYGGSILRAGRAGHIPNAVNIDWKGNLDKDSFKDRHSLQQLYSKIPKDAQVIAYCQGGYRAANTFVVLKMLGYQDVRMYLGSWGEWGNRPDLPVSRR